MGAGYRYDRIPVLYISKLAEFEIGIVDCRRSGIYIDQVRYRVDARTLVERGGIVTLDRGYFVNSHMFNTAHPVT